ncbi:stage II sporulation protein P [Brevibacillus sp. NRS-1366]|uniref:stage II sporulation protein P n=1 Tax=Brevibacillus sp. NRS-1366 TaxID=3233899 RepID=UPI003D24A3C2
MPNMEQLIQQIKALKEEPDKGFVTGLEAKLVKQANQIEAKSKAMRYVGVACGFIVCLLLIGSFKMNAEQRVPAYVEKLESPAVLIYQTHSQESFHFEAKTPADSHAVSDPENNISLVGKGLADSLQKNNVSTIQSASDFQQEVASVQENVDVYTLSREYVKGQLAIHPHLKVVLDVHRDSRTREMTTLTMNNKTMAKIRLVVNNAHPGWEMNRQFAFKISDKAKELYPQFPIEVSQRKGISSTYWNQDLHPHAVLVEIGGIENTWEEEFDSTDLLAQIIAEVLRDEGIVT